MRRSFESTESAVCHYVADWISRPTEEVTPKLDLVRDVDWERIHPDDRLDAMLTMFVRKFQVYVAAHDPKVVAEQRGVPGWRYPFLRIALWLWPPAIEVERITVADLVRVAELGLWPATTEGGNGVA